MHNFRNLPANKINIYIQEMKDDYPPGSIHFVKKLISGEINDFESLIIEDFKEEK